jgi:hypothetical protein
VAMMARKATNLLESVSLIGEDYGE